MEKRRTNYVSSLVSMLHSSKLKCHVASGPVLVQNTLFGILIDFKEGSQYSLVAISQKEQANSGSILSFYQRRWYKFFCSRWCPSLPEYFAIAPTSHGTSIRIWNANYLHAQASAIEIAPAPRRITDFDWLFGKGSPRIIVALERQAIIFPISI